MDSYNFYEELKLKFRGEDRAKLLMQQLRALHDSKQQKKWWRKIAVPRKPKTQPQAWK